MFQFNVDEFYLTNCLKKFSLMFRKEINAEGVPTSHQLLELLEAVYHHHTLEEKSVVEAACRLTTDDDLKALSQIFSSYFDSMRTDFIKYVGELTDDGTTVLAEILEHKYRSRDLYLHKGSSKNGLMSLAKALYHNSTIYVLNLNHNGIGDSVAVSLSQTLRHNSTLRELHLGGNSIGNEGAIALAQSLHQNSTLQILDLSNNNSISDEGAVALARALLKNHSLQMLSLVLIFGICEGVASEFVEALAKNLSIKRMTLSKDIKKYAVRCPNYNEVEKKFFVVIAV